MREGEVIDRGQLGEVKRRSAGAGGHKLNKPPISDQVHVVLWVIKANDVRLTQDKYYDKFKFVTQMLKKECKFNLNSDFDNFPQLASWLV